MLHKNAVIFAVVSHIYCKTYSFDVFAVVLWVRAEKSALSRRVFIENAVVLGEASGVPCANFDPEAVGLLSNELCESPIWRAFARYFAAIKSVLCYISVFCL